MPLDGQARQLYKLCSAPGKRSATLNGSQGRLLSSLLDSPRVIRGRSVVPPFQEIVRYLLRCMDLKRFSTSGDHDPVAKEARLPLSHGQGELTEGMLTTNLLVN